MSSKIQNNIPHIIPEHFFEGAPSRTTLFRLEMRFFRLTNRNGMFNSYRVAGDMIISR